MKLIDDFFYYLEKEETISKISIKLYKKDILDFKEYIGKENLLDVNNENILDYLNILKKSYSENSIIRKVTALKALYKYFLKKNYIKSSPLEKISLSRKNLKIGGEIEGFEIKAILDVIKEEKRERKDRLIIKILWETGLKISEVLNLKISELKRKNFKSFGLKKGKEYVIIEISENLSLELKKYIEEYEENLNLSLDTLFQGVTNQNFKDRFIKYSKRAKLERTLLPSMIRNKYLAEIKNKEKNNEKENKTKEIKKEYLRIGIGDEN